MTAMSYKIWDKKVFNFQMALDEVWSMYNLCWYYTFMYREILEQNSNILFGSGTVLVKCKNKIFRLKPLDLLLKYKLSPPPY